MELKKLLGSAALGNSADVLSFVERFTPLLKKYSTLLKYEDAYYDLQLRLLELIPIIANHPQLQYDKQISVYIKNSIKNEYFLLGRKNAEYVRRQFNLDNDFEEKDQIINQKGISVDDYFGVEFSDVFSRLTPSERLAIIGTVVQGYTSAYIARQLGCTRQSINQAKRRGLNKLRAALQLDVGKDETDEQKHAPKGSLLDTLP